MKAVWNLKRNDMEVRNNSFSSEVFVDLSYKEADLIYDAIHCLRAGSPLTDEQDDLLCHLSCMLNRLGD